MHENEQGREIGEGSERAPLSAWLACVGILICIGPVHIASAQAPIGSGLGSDVIDLLDADPAPRVVVDPAERYLLLVRSRQLLSLGRLAEPAVDLGGRRINPETAAPHAPIEYYALTLIDLESGAQQEIALPRGAVLGYPQWSPDGRRFAFTLSRPGSEMELWIGLPDEARARPLLSGLNGVIGSSCEFVPVGHDLLCKRLVRQPGSTASGSPATAGLLQGSVPQAIEGGLARQLLESRLELVDSETGQRHVIGSPAAFESVTSAPAGAHLLIERIVPPYPRYVDVDPVVTVREIRDRFGRLVIRLPETARAIGWHASRPAEIVWIESSGDVDRVMTLDAPFADEPVVRFELMYRFAGLRWIGNRDAALVSDYDAVNRRTVMWYVPMGSGEHGEPRQLLSYASSDPRIPLMRPNARGMDTVADRDGRVLLHGHEIVDDRRQVFLERIDLDSGDVERIWQAPDDGRQELVDVLGAHGDHLLIRHESPRSPPNYLLSRLDGRVSRAITSEEHPAPALVDADRLRLEYLREDGTELSASLYLPPDRNPGERLPLIVWAYPQRVMAGSNARLPDTTDRFPTFERAFRHYFLLRGYAVLDDVSMPVVGDDDSANDTFIDQIVADASAAVSAAGATGHIDPLRIGVAGHSYGAFMVANLLAHSDLFRAGVALSGAYNRTLTPFGFQTERRTLWDAPDTYIAMSPIIFADRIEAPLLLVHGLSDDNAGTAPIQSTQFFQAIRGNGGEAELLLLPWEGHVYRGRESVLATASGMLDWFDRHLRGAGVVSIEDTGAFLRP